jgi:quercetin dioxygenase-like cupin family protein
MQIVRIYTGSDNQTHFQHLDVASFEPMATNPGQGPIRMNHGPGNTVMDFHNAPRRQYVVLLAGQMEIETGLGEKRTLTAGDVLVAEDLTGKGHITRSSSERVTLSVPLA